MLQFHISIERTFIESTQNSVHMKTQKLFTYHISQYTKNISLFVGVLLKAVAFGSMAGYFSLQLTISSKVIKNGLSTFYNSTSIQ